MGLLQPVLVLQLMIPLEKPFGFELVLSDQQSRKRRLICSTNFREIEATELHAKVDVLCVSEPERCIDRFVLRHRLRCLISHATSGSIWLSISLS